MWSFGWVLQLHTLKKSHDGENQQFEFLVVFNCHRLHDYLGCPHPRWSRISFKNSFVFFKKKIFLSLVKNKKTDLVPHTSSMIASDACIRGDLEWRVQGNWTLIDCDWGINQGKRLSGIDSLGFNCLGSAIEDHLGCSHPRQLCWQYVAPILFFLTRLRKNSSKNKNKSSEKRGFRSSTKKIVFLIEKKKKKSWNF